MTTTHITKKQVGGFGLIELMIAILLGILVLGGVGQVFYSTSQAYRTQQSVARVQEAGRFAIEILKPRLLPAGRLDYCTGLNTNVVDSALNTGAAGYEAAVHDMNDAIVGFEHAGTDLDDTYPLPAPLGTGAVSAGDYSTGFGLMAVPQTVVDNAVPGSDVLIIKYSASVDQITGCDYDVAAADLSLNYPMDCRSTAAAPLSQAEIDSIFPLGRLVISSNCRTNTVFQRTNVGSPVLSLNNGGTVPGNLPALMDPDVSDTTQILPVNSMMFFVGVNAGGQPALFQVNYGTDRVPEEIIEGVENMQVLFGQSDNLGAVTYLEPHLVTSSRDVVAIRVALLIRSTQNADLEIDEEVYTLNGTTIDPVDDSRLRQVFSTTVAVRNRVNVN